MGLFRENNKMKIIESNAVIISLPCTSTFNLSHKFKLMVRLIEVHAIRSKTKQRCNADSNGKCNY